MREEVADAIDRLNGRRESAKKLHDSGAKGSEVALALTAAIDQAILTAVEEAGAPDNLTAVAVGGYGRAELCPHSDVDVLFIVGSGIESSFLAQRIMHFLWDMGLNIGHSVRNVGQVLQTYKDDHDSWAATLEYRYVAGSKKLFVKLESAIRDFVTKNTDRSFVKSTLDGIRVRHNKYGRSTSLLEPNLKKSFSGSISFRASSKEGL
ncbi:MAG: hypothetical protein M1378_08065 [Bacteroidetes bacterium]|nr:hypothetical protein [Bacteroidota bacterium]